MHGESSVCPEFCAGDDYEVSCTVSQPPRTLCLPSPSYSLYNRDLETVLNCDAILQQTSETTRAHGLMGSAGSARLDTSVHDCRWLRQVTDQLSLIHI